MPTTMSTQKAKRRGRDGLVRRLAEDARCSLFRLAAMEEGLSQIVGWKVDLVEREAIEQSENYIRCRHILRNEEPVYMAR